MHLLSPSAVFSRLKIQQDSQIEELISSSLEGTTFYIESVLDTRCAKDQYTDSFKIVEGVAKVVNGFYRLKMANGFLFATPAVEVSVTTDSPFATATPSWAVLDSWAFTVNYEKGFVDLDEGYKNHFVKVTYTAGFTGPQDVPGWLAEVVMAYTIKLMSIQRLGDDKPQLKDIYAFLDMHKSMVLDRHMRSSSHAIPSLRSVVVP